MAVSGWCSVPETTEVAIPYALKTNSSNADESGMRVLVAGLVALVVAAGAPAVSSAAPVIEVEPTAIDFGTADPGTQTGAAEVTVRNTGSSAAEDVSFAIAGADAGQFVMPDATGACTPLPPSFVCIVGGLRFAPTSAGPKSARFEVRIGGTAVATVSLAGVGGSPHLVALPTELAFDTITAGEQSDPVVLRVTNTGTGTAHDVTFRVVGPDASQFDVPTSPGPCATMTIFLECQLLLRFAPTRPGEMTATYEVRIGGQLALAIPLTGRALPTGAPVAQASPAAIVFRSTRVGRWSSAVVTVANVGGQYSLLTIDGAALAGIDRERFGIVVDGCSRARLIFEESCAIVVRFRPRALGVARATLELASDDAASPLRVGLEAVGVRRPPPSSGGAAAPPVQPQPVVVQPSTFRLAWLTGQVTTRKRRYTLPLRSPLAGEATITVTRDGRIVSTRRAPLVAGRNAILVTALRPGRNVVTVAATASASGLDARALATKVVTVLG